MIVSDVILVNIALSAVVGIGGAFLTKNNIDIDLVGIVVLIADVALTLISTYFLLPVLPDLGFKILVPLALFTLNTVCVRSVGVKAMEYYINDRPNMRRS